MNKMTFGMSLATFALVIGLAAPSAFAAGGGVNSGGVNSGGVSSGGASTGGGKTGGGGNPSETGGTSTSTSSICMKVSASATEASSYYTMLTLSNNVQNCSTQTETVDTKWSAGAGASATCAASLSGLQTAEAVVAPGGRVAQTAIAFSSCTPADPIVATVTTNDGQVLATATAGWVTGVTP